MPSAPRADPAALLFTVFALTTGSSGCNLVQGYEDAGDALFPEQSTHLAAPGLRLASGNYSSLGVIGGSELYMVAREAGDATGKLHAMRYAEPAPCELQRVGRYGATSDASRSAPLISYFHEDVRKGTLHFADATCKTYPLSFEQARLPVGETEQGVVVWADSDLWLATPETGGQERLASGVSNVINRVFGGRFAVLAEQRLAMFDKRWKAQGIFGDQVSSVLRAGKSLFYLDDLGAHRIVESEADSSVVEDELLVSDACSLTSQDRTWITLRSPCSGGELLAIHEPTGQSFTLPFEADVSQIKLVPALKSPGLDPLSDPFWFFYVRSGGEEGSEDTLYVRTPAGVDHALGAQGTFRHLRLEESESETYGYALVDVAGETGRYVWWNEAGKTRVLAENVLWRPDRLIVDFDGTFGKVAVVSGDDLVVLAERVLWNAFEYQDNANAWTVLLHDVQAGGTGQLSVFNDSIDALETTPREHSAATPLLPIASDVVAFSTSPLENVLSGVVYLTNFDPATLTGRLEYRNLELRFTARVSDGVSGYVVGHDEILYTVPYGDNAGIWLARGK